MDKRLWQIEADILTKFGEIKSYSVRLYAEDAGAAWLKFLESFEDDASWQAISVNEVKRIE